MIEPLERVEDLTPTWLTQALADASGGATVVEAQTHTSRHGTGGRQRTSCPHLGPRRSRGRTPWWRR